MTIKLTSSDCCVEIDNHISLEDNILNNINDVINQFHKETGISFYENKYSIYTDWDDGYNPNRNIVSDPIDEQIEYLELDIDNPAEGVDKKLQDMRDYLFEKINKIDKLLIDKQ